jgi:hypothetical protein
MRVADDDFPFEAAPWEGQDEPRAQGGVVVPFAPVQAYEEAAAPPEGENEQPANALSFTIADWSMDRFAGEAPPIQWLCEGTIPLGVPALFAAMGGVGKSFIALDVALEIAVEVAAESGRRLLGGRIMEHGSVVVLNAEDGKDSVHRRLVKIDPGGRREAANGRVFVVPLPEVGGPVTLVAGGQGEVRKTPAFEALLVQLEAIDDLKLVVIDPLQAFITADVTKDPAAGQFMWSALAQICARTGATVIVCHHMRKEGAANIQTADEAREAIRGSTSLVDGARATYALWAADDIETKRVCEEAGVATKPKRVIRGAVVKANDEHDLDVHTYIRAESGLLMDATALGKRVAAKGGGLSEAQALEALKEIDKRWNGKRPFGAVAQSGDRYIIHWLVKHFRVSKEVAKKQLEDWYFAEMVASMEHNTNTKMMGLRVVKWPR